MPNLDQLAYTFGCIVFEQDALKVYFSIVLALTTKRSTQCDYFKELLQYNEPCGALLFPKIALHVHNLTEEEI